MKKFLAVLLVLVLALFASQALAFEGKIAWKVRYDSGITGGVSLSGSHLFFGDNTGKFYAVSRNNGAIIWTAQGTTAVHCGTPAVTSSGHVIFAQGDGAISCCNISDGKIVWQYVPKDDEKNSDVDAHEDILDGTEAGGGRIYASKGDRKLYAHDEKNGKVLWTYEVSDQGIRNVPSYYDGQVFLGEYNGLFTIVDAKTGKRIGGGGAGGAINTPVVNNGNVYFSSWDGSVSAVKIKGIEPLWTVKVGDPVTTEPTVSEGIVVVGTGRGNIVALNANDGKEIWRYATDIKNGEISTAPLIGDSVVIAGADSGSVCVFNAKTGALLHTIPELNGITFDGLYSEGTFFFVSSGEVCALR